MRDKQCDFMCDRRTAKQKQENNRNIYMKSHVLGADALLQRPRVLPAGNFEIKLLHNIGCREQVPWRTPNLKTADTWIIARSHAQHLPAM